MSRYKRQIKLEEIGSSGQLRLNQAKVTIIGAGGLGIPSALYLAGSGVGTINIVDFDKVDLSNLHRQIIYTENDIGKSKSKVLSKHLSSLNSEITVNAIDDRLEAHNTLSLLKETDIVLDCSDNLDCRFLINDACVILDKPFVSASIHKYEGQLSVFNYRNGPSYRCLYEVPKDASIIANCEDIGVLGTLPGILGTMQANETLKIILNFDSILYGKVLLINVINYSTSIFKLSRKNHLIESVKKKGFLVDKSSKYQSNGIDWNVVEDRMKHEKVSLIDIRESHEMPRINSDLIFNFPLSQDFELNFNSSDQSTIVCFCQSGIRSLQAVKRLKEIGMINVYSLNKGIEEIINSNFFKSKEKLHYEK